MSDQDIFDTENTDDLPFKFRRRVKTQSDIIIGFFKLAGRPLNNKELRAAYYRTTKEEISSEILSARVCDLISENKLKRIGRGLYELINQEIENEER